MPMKLKRISDIPILKPLPDHPWEAAAVFNCAAVPHHGRIHMIYRATDIASDGSEGPFVSSLGGAVSDDGVHFERDTEPLLRGEGPQELRGLEDPRVVKIEDTFYMMYTGYRGLADGDFKICLASSSDLTSWKRHGVVLDESNKDGSLFPEKIGGRFVMFHRRSPDIWIAFSEDLETWTDHRRVMGPLADSPWESVKIGIAGPPMKTDQGWLLIYHGVSEDHVYSLGIALLDPNDPSRVVARQREPLLEPELVWEKEGHVPNVVFSCGQIEQEDRILVYYCGADTVIGAAVLDKKAITFS